ncbi:hypothetical protein ACRALDRAFT_1093105 [Sodiomyces alcalophilus JCM 7366]|uniref:uncharacterized protein n=1 Tax=Sodiomyces alcalophilus JCM 7366 TaxID=591952 RepID=UPI0039B6B391
MRAATLHAMTTKADLQDIPPCHPQACAIQRCLNRNNYDENQCQSAIVELYHCCERFYGKQGNTAISPSCPKADVLRLKLVRIRQAKDTN